MAYEDSFSVDRFIYILILWIQSVSVLYYCIAAAAAAPARTAVAAPTTPTPSEPPTGKNSATASRQTPLHFLLRRPSKFNKPLVYFGALKNDLNRSARDSMKLGIN
uniref:Uncharacterized protein n=1 Tax=Solanum lycopersicum TaxID=4081 RepID=A0A3Q7J8W4_SOLLC